MMESPISPEKIHTVPDLVKGLKKWMYFELYRMLSIFPILIIIMWYFVLESWMDTVHIFSSAITLKHIYIAVIIILEILQVYVYKLQIKVTSNEITGVTYRLDLGIHNKEEIFSLMEKKFQLEHIEEDCWYVDNLVPLKHFTRQCRLFVFVFEENPHDNDLETADQYVNKVNEARHFVHGYRYKTLPITERAQVFIYDKVPENILKTAQDNAPDDNGALDCLTNFFIDLNEGILYIPLVHTRKESYGYYGPNVDAIERIGKLLDLI